VRRQRPHAPNVDAVGPQDLIELLDELRIMIAHQQLRSFGLFGEEHRDVPRLHVDKEQHEDVHKPAHGPDLFREEIALPQRLPVTLDEVGPGAFAALRPRVETSFTQDVHDSRAADRTNPEFLQLPEDAGVAPASLVRDPQHSLTNLGYSSRSATLLLLAEFRLRRGLGSPLCTDPA